MAVASAAAELLFTGLLSPCRGWVCLQGIAPEGTGLLPEGDGVIGNTASESKRFGRGSSSGPVKAVNLSVVLLRGVGQGPPPVALTASLLAAKSFWAVFFIFS
ncbi:hypothetical protein HPB47_004976 [Ixodes persulcatus]|uniref:Uncharacterized protein n=1 Tax=Ixodes persulcatus TaxID=34615 RepID=A0AC60PEH7_IXOPE|nr:hypothetical protein HPB47_004976 [Ixodes persulcatus]